MSRHFWDMLLVPEPRPLIQKNLSLNRDYDRYPYIKALKRKGFMNHCSTFTRTPAAPPFPEKLKQKHLNPKA